MGLGITGWCLQMVFWTRRLMYNRIVPYECNERREATSREARVDFAFASRTAPYTS